MRVCVLRMSERQRERERERERERPAHFLSGEGLLLHEQPGEHVQLVLMFLQNAFCVCVGLIREPLHLRVQCVCVWAWREWT